MAHVVSGQIRKAPFIKEGCGQDGQSTMYAIELSEMTKDYATQEKQYANYKALFFAKTDGAKAFYAKAFEEGSFVVVGCEKLKVEQRDHNGQVYVSLVMDNPRLEGAMTNEQQQGGNDRGGNWSHPQQPNGGQPYQQQQQQPQKQYNQQPQQMPTQAQREQQQYQQAPQQKPCACGGRDPNCPTCGIPF